MIRLSMDLNKHHFNTEDIRVLRVDRPALYWITCSNCIPPDEINEHLRTIILKNSTKLVSVISPQPNDRVIVKGTDGIFLRGIVRTLEGSMCNVWLVDVCKYKEVECKEMFVNDLLLWRDLDGQAHIIGVNGLPDCSQPDPQLTKTYTERINMKVEHFFQYYSDFHFSFNNFFMANEIPYGDITLSKKKLKLDWSKTLIENGAFKSLDTDFTEVGLSHPVEKTFENASNAPTQIVNLTHVTNILAKPKESIVALSKGFITDLDQVLQSSSNVQLIPLNYYYNNLPKSSAYINRLDNAPDEEDFKPIKIVSPNVSCSDYLIPKNRIKTESNEIKTEFFNNNSVSVCERGMEKPQTVFRVGRCRPRLNNYSDPLTHSDHGLGRGKYIKHLLTCQLNNNYAHERHVLLNDSIERQNPIVYHDDIIKELPESVDSNRHLTIDSNLNALEANINDPTPTFNDNARNNVDDNVSNAVLPDVKNYASDSFLFSDDEETSEENKPFSISGVDYIISESLERMKNSCALLHGYPQPKLVSSFNALGLNQLITMNLRAMDIVVVAKCQIYSIPVQLAKKNLVLIGPAGTKKTTSYILPLLSHLLDKSPYSQLNDGYGPRGVIIVPNAQRVLYVADLCSDFCNNQLKVVATHGDGLELQNKDAVSNGCDILVSTPRCFLRLLTYKHLTDIDRLCHIVFDSYDYLSALFHNELNEIYSRINTLEKLRQEANLNYDVQRVFVGKTWNKSIEEIVFHHLLNPVLCITAHLEAAIYAQVKLHFAVLKAETKEEKLLEIIKENKIVRTVVVCNTPIEVKLLKEFLSCYSSNIIVAHEDLHHSFIQETIDAWKSNSDFLICSDQVLLELGITNAQWLINYSIPLNKTAFSDRFSLLQDNFSDRISNPKVEPSKCKAHILIEDGNELQYPKLISLVERSNAKVPDSFKELSEKIKDNREKLRSNQPFCDKLLQFGQCRKTESCLKQHVIDLNRDKPTVPDHGYIIVTLIEIADASHYSARIVSTADTLSNDISESDWEPYPSQMAQLNFIMSEYFSNEQNRQIVRKPKIGGFVAVYDESADMFLRAEIKAIRSTSLTKVVVIWMIDDGGTHIIKAEKLFKLPKAAQLIPPQIVSLYIANIQPFDLDLAWSRTANKLVKREICDADAKFTNLLYISKIILAIGSKVIVEDLCIYEKLSLLDCYLTRVSVKRIMLTQGLGLKCDIHLKHLKKLAIEAQMIQPDEEDSLISSDNKWAHLSEDKLTRVLVSHCQNPHLFYVCQTDLQSKLGKLNADLKVALEKDEVKHLDLIEVETLCAIKINEQEWCRGCVYNIIDGLEIEVLLVDFGLKIIKNISDLYEIPEDLITKLPFQAVECELEGVSPAKGVWCERGNSWFLSSLEDEGNPKTFELKVCDIKYTAEITGRPHYSVLLFVYSNPTTVCLNTEIVNRGYGNWNDQENNQEIIEAVLKELPDEQPLDAYLKDKEYLLNRDTSSQSLNSEPEMNKCSDIYPNEDTSSHSQSSEHEINKGVDISMKYSNEDDDDDSFTENGFHCVGISNFCSDIMKSFTNNNLLGLDWQSADSDNNEVASNQTNDLLSLDWQSAESDNNELIPTQTLEYGNHKNDSIVNYQDELDIKLVNGDNSNFSIINERNPEVIKVKSEGRKVSIIEESENIAKDELIKVKYNNLSILEDSRNIGKDNVSVLEKVEKHNVSIIEELDKDNVSIVEKDENLYEDNLSSSNSTMYSLSSASSILSSIEERKKNNVSIVEKGENLEEYKASVLKESVIDNASIPRDGEINKVDNESIIVEGKNGERINLVEGEDLPMEIVERILNLRTKWAKNHDQFTSAPIIDTRDINVFVGQKSPCLLDSNKALEVSHLKPVIDGDKVPHLEPAFDDNKVSQLESTHDDEVPYLDSNVPHLVPAYPSSTPRVHWRQDSDYVWVKVLAPNISTFQINSTQDYIVVQAWVELKLYWLDIELFGPIKRKSLITNQTGQYLNIKFEKLCNGYVWPRLTYLDTVTHNIKHDPDHDHMFYNNDQYDDPEDFHQFDDYESDSSSTVSSEAELQPIPSEPFDHEIIDLDS